MATDTNYVELENTVALARMELEDRERLDLDLFDGITLFRMRPTLIFQCGDIKVTGV